MRRLRYAVRSLVVLLLAAAPVVVVAPTAHAAATPWAFSPVGYAEVQVGPFGIAEVVHKCPAEYVAIGGGWGTFAPSGSLEPMAAYRDVRDGLSAWVVVQHNFINATYNVHSHAVCAKASQVGTVTTVSADLARNGDGIAGGQKNCPGGQKAIGGGADWNGGSTTRRLDVSAPTATGDGWMVSGWNSVSDTLHVEAYCVSAADLGVSSPTITTTDYASTTTFNLLKVCPAGQRAATGGLMTAPFGSATPDPTTYRAVMESGHTQIPVDNEVAVRWHSSGRVEGGTRLFHSVWCLPASQPVVTLMTRPPQFTNSTSATFTYTAIEPSGETLNISCRVDLDFVSCPGGFVQVTNLSQGTHTFTVSAQNSSRMQDSDSHTWTVDLSPPVAVPPNPTVPLNGPVTLGFNEPVSGVTTSSLQVRVAGTNTPLQGTVALAPGAGQASWTPASPLVPGETYAVSTTTAIKDRAGNSLPADTYLVQATGVVESTASVLKETWDVDNAAAAFGGKYAASRSKDSSATWRFSASAGQRATLYGVRRPNGGRAAVYVDGVKKATVSFYRSATTYKVPVFTSAALSSGQHTVEVRALGTKPAASSGTWVNVDALGVGGTRRQESSATQRFQRITTASASGGSFDSVLHATSGDNGSKPAYVLVFKGTGISILATKGPSSGSARIYVDGVLKKTVNLRAAATSYQFVIPSITGLSETRHTLRIEPVGTSSGSGSAVGIDRINVLNP